MIEFAEKLKGLRKLRGWSQEELARRLKVSRSKIGNYEQGTREPDFESLEALADIFNCTINDLVGDDMTPEEIALLDKYRSLNFIGKKEVERYMEFACSRPEYRRESESDASSDVS